MSSKNKNNATGSNAKHSNAAAGTSTADADVAEENRDNATGTEGAEANTGGAAPAHVEVTEQPAASTLSIVPQAAATPAVPKVRLFWQKTCHNQKESTNTEIKPGEVFVRTSHKVMVLADGATEAHEEVVYSMKRGKRIYYTPSSFITDAQRAEADTATDAKTQEKEAAAKVKADEKAKKDAEKKAKAEGGAKVVTGPTVVAPVAAAEPAPAATSEADMEEVK